MTELTSRTLLQRDDFKNVSGCTLRGIGMPTVTPAFSQAIQKIAQENDKNVVDRAGEFVSYYMGNEFDLIKPTRPDWAFTFYNSLLFDVDPKRRAHIANFVQQNGCGDAVLDAVCAHALLMLPEFLQMGMTSALPQCTNLPHNAACTSNLFTQISRRFEELEHDITAFRQQHKSVTYTDQWRADHLYKLISIEAAKPSSVFKSPPSRVLIVGPGLERLNLQRGTRTPYATYEPFAVAKSCTTVLRAIPTQLRIDVLDINPDVIDHMNDVSARKTEYHFNSQRGNIITDKVADGNSYDIVVILNTFMYFTNRELVLAMENIERLLKPGGVLITDMGPGAQIDVAYPAECPKSPAEKMHRQNISGKWIPLTFAYIKTALTN